MVTCLLSAPTSAQQDAPPPADPADVESIDAIMTAVYDVISGDAGVVRDWDRFRSLFAPGATLSPVGRPAAGSTYGRRVVTPDEYARNAGAFLEENGFHEVEIPPGHRAVRGDRARVQHLRVAPACLRPGTLRSRHQFLPTVVRRHPLVGRLDLLAAGER